jgi:hypothetical protein
MRHSPLAPASLVPLAALALGATCVFAQPAAKPPASAPAAPASQPATPDSAGPPRLPPFAGTVVSFDRRGDRVVACVDRSNVQTRPPGPGATPPPSGPKPPPAYRIWLIEREVMQELMTTGGLCGPVWSPDGKTFLAAGARGLFAFTEPQYEARVLMLASTPPPPTPPVNPTPAPPASETAKPGPPNAPVTVKTTEPAPIPFSQTAWSPGGRRVAFLLTTDGVAKVRVVDAKDGSVVFTRDQRANLLQWGPDDRTLVIDGVRVSLPS